MSLITGMKKIGFTREWMTFLGFGVTKLHRISGIARNTIYNLIEDFEPAQIGTKKAIADAMGITVETLRNISPSNQTITSKGDSKMDEDEVLSEAYRYAHEDDLDIRQRVYGILNHFDAIDLNHVFAYLEGYLACKRRETKKE